jgi:Phospholipase_D-nuclease N-terminal
MILAADYPLLEILATVVFFFLWVCWFWTLVVVLSDVFGRSDLSGGGKAGWTLFVIFLPFLGVLVYLIAHGGEMGERSARRASAGGGAAGQIAEAKRLLDTGAIDAAEYEQLKSAALA